MKPDDPSDGGQRRDASVQAWIDALRGREPVAGLGASSRTGAMLRKLVLQAQRDRLEAEGAYEQDLLDRWAGMGLLQPGRRHATTSGWRLAVSDWLSRRSRWMGVSAMAGASLLIGVAVLRLPLEDSNAPDPDASVTRGAEPALQLSARDPAELALRIEASLQRGQAAVKRSDLPSGAVQLQAKVPAEAKVLRQELATLGITVPDHGRLNLIISSAR
jgi:hypothetical protein